MNVKTPAQTFEKIAEDKNYFYSDEMAKIIVDEVNTFGGDFVLEDVTGYELEEVDALTFEIGVWSCFGIYFKHYQPFKIKRPI